eukprot:TRINITY_DN2897_c0_g1_i2.p1 TRINITY_DN2897_c0_g1~~TRINITY_DN2897_c0_g1_i2.p1  ORF type:complete len:152 (-),score=37.16 TRINITY_DN2897_c0_g1_i2:5-460(-)
MWAEMIVRQVLHATGMVTSTQSTVMSISQRVYYPIFRLFSVATFGAIFYDCLVNGQSAVNRHFFQVEFKLNPYVINGYFDYWFGRLWGFINGMMIIITFFNPKFGRIYGKVFVWGLVLWSINALPSTLLKTSYLLGQSGIPFGSNLIHSEL